ncbi:MAG: DUF3854 domain-containing protein [Lachnospira sp.]|nr:DUF3854 domain-containing protein [Lachnospira sp.]
MVQSVKRNDPCRICGKGDWCGRMPSDKGYMLHICQRIGDVSDVFSTVDGQFYVRVGTGKSGTSIFADANELKRSKDENANGKKEYFKYEEKPVTYVNTATLSSNKRLNQVYSELDKLLKLEPYHREYLHKEGFTDELIERHKIRSLPISDYYRWQRGKSNFTINRSRKAICADLANILGSLAGVPGFYQREADGGRFWTLNGRSGILFPVYDEESRQIRKRVRLDYDDYAVNYYHDDIGKYYIDNGKKYYVSMGGVKELLPDGTLQKIKDLPKYLNISSYREDTEASSEYIKVNYYLNGCESGNQLSLYMGPTDDMYCCYFTEGEKKGIIGNHFMRSPVVHIPGVNSYAKLLQPAGLRILEKLKEKGTKVLIVAFDADKATNNSVLRAEAGTVKLLKELGFSVAVADWNEKYKGLDDALLAKARGDNSVNIRYTVV